MQEADVFSYLQLNGGRLGVTGSHLNNLLLKSCVKKV